MSCKNNDQHAPPPITPPELDITLSTIKSTSQDWSDDEIQNQLPTEVLLITANDHEFAACYSYMKHVQRSWCDILGMVDFGQFGDQNVRVALMKQCAQGPAAALTAVKDAAELLYPKVVLFVGICASMRPAKAKLGDVVISAKLSTYSDRKVREDGIVEYRGPKANVSRYMSRRILSAADGWEPPLKDPSSLKVEVHRDAVMLSGPELVDNLERRQELSNYFRDALGLEMEGAGLYAAAYDLGIEWAVIKAVSDFGDGSKTATKDWQPFASVMAASLVHNMFKQAHVIKQWPHYKINSRMTDTTDAKKTEQEESSNEDEYKGQKELQPASRMCVSCRATNEIQLPDDRNEWPIHKIEIGYFQKICKLLDLDDASQEPILSALECFNHTEVATIKKKFEAKGGIGVAEYALHKWGTTDRKNNVGALKKIIEETMERVDVLDEIEKWEKLSVCHGCGIKLKIQQSDN